MNATSSTVRMSGEDFPFAGLGVWKLDLPTPASEGMRKTSLTLGRIEIEVATLQGSGRMENRWDLGTSLWDSLSWSSSSLASRVLAAAISAGCPEYCAPRATRCRS